MRIENLLAFLLDPHFGGSWPPGPDGRAAPFRPTWKLGDTWRVEVTFRRPALPLGQDVRGIWRYTVVGEEVRDGVECFVVEVAQDRAGERKGYFRAAYRRSDLALIEATRYEGGEERRFDFKPWGGLQETCEWGPEGEGLVRRHTSLPT